MCPRGFSTTYLKEIRIHGCKTAHFARSCTNCSALRQQDPLVHSGWRHVPDWQQLFWKGTVWVYSTFNEKLTRHYPQEKYVCRCCLYTLSSFMYFLQGCILVNSPPQAVWHLQSASCIRSRPFTFAMLDIATLNLPAPSLCPNVLV